jgi:hypothetical protein
MAETRSPFQEMIENFQKPEVQDFLHHIQCVAGFLLPPSVNRIFDLFHHHCFDSPRPQFIRDFDKDPDNSKWQRIYSESIFGSAQPAVSAVFYHRENLLRIERDILSFIYLDKLVKTMGKTLMGGGNTRKLDFEYHAFVFAYRRSLDFLSRGIASLLKEDLHSFRKLPLLRNNHPECPWLEEILEIHLEFAPQLKSFIGTEKDRSIRDKLAHYLNVPAGALNVNSNGVFFSGVGEKVDHSTRLKDVIDNYIKILVKIFTVSLEAMSKGLPKET